MLNVTGLLGPYAAYIKQFYDLLTGVTTDQAVTLKNAFSADSPTLVVDAVNHGVGVGTTSPNAVVQVGVNDTKTSLRIEGSSTPIGLHAINTGGYGTFGIDAPDIVDGRFIVNDSGYVGVGIVSPGYKLDVNGPCHASSFPTSSDQRFKDKVQPLPAGILDKVKRLRGVSFEWNKHYSDLGRKGQAGRNIGFIAQELEQEFPEVVSKWGEGDPDYEHAAEEYRGVDYGRMVPVLLEAIKELATQNDTLTDRVTALEAAMAAIKAKLGI